MRLLVTLFLLVMPLAASIICIVKHPIWVGVLGIIGWVLMLILLGVSKTETSSNIISNSKINISNDNVSEKSHIIQSVTKKN